MTHIWRCLGAHGEPCDATGTGTHAQIVRASNKHAREHPTHTTTIGAEA